RKQGYEIVLRSEDRSCKENTEIFIGDTTGELLMLYRAADVAFVGGSLVPVGGHNLLEPAAVGIPAITGKEMHNFTEITSLLLQAKAIRQVEDVRALTQNLQELLLDKALRQAMGECGKAVIAKNRGALEKHLDLITHLTTKYCDA